MTDQHYTREQMEAAIAHIDACKSFAHDSVYSIVRARGLAAMLKQLLAENDRLRGLCKETQRTIARHFAATDEEMEETGPRFPLLDIYEKLKAEAQP